MFLKNKTLPIIACLSLGTIFALLIVTARELSSTLSVQQQVYGRSFLALLISVPLFYKHFVPSKLVKIPKQDVYLATIRGLLLYVLAVSLFSYAAIHSTVFMTSVLGGLPFAAMLGVIFFREKLTVLRLVALVLAFIGVVIMGNPSAAELQFGKGEFAAIASGLFFGLAYVSRRLHSAKITNPQISSMMYLSGTVGLLLLSLLLGQGLVSLKQLTPATTTWLIIGGFLNVANIMLTNYVFSKLPAVVANVLLMSEFVFAIVLGYIVYLEVPQIFEIVGAAFVIFSIVLVSYSEQKSGSG